MNLRRSGDVTLVDVAREAGVSVATASRALNGSTRIVGENLRDRVLVAAGRLDYSPSAPAQAMVRGRTNVVALLVHDIADPYFSAIASGVMEAADEHRLLVTLGDMRREPSRELQYLALTRAQRSKAAIVVGSRLSDTSLLRALAEEVTSFENGGGRVVLISQAKLPVDTVSFENRAGARALAIELAALGYARFAVLGGPRKLFTARDRVSGFRAGLKSAGVTAAPLVAHGEFTRDGGYAAMSELLARRESVDCVFAANDVMAVGAMAACRDRGLDLPRDLALAGFDDIATLRDVHPALTTVRLPLEDAGRAALEMVVEDDPHRHRTVRIPGEVVIRESTPSRR
jgi:LacI family transcriptional regulator